MDEQALRWLAGRLAWERRLEQLRDNDVPTPAEAAVRLDEAA